VKAVDGPELLTPSEAAAMFGVSTKTLGRWRAQGRISFLRTPGGETRYSRPELEQLVNNSRSAS
jgi:excisionase family DNA binding protein